MKTSMWGPKNEDVYVGVLRMKTSMWGPKNEDVYVGVLNAVIYRSLSRFEVQIEVGLPDEEGRREIFEIHTNSMAVGGMLGSDVNLRELAANTTSYSGAEIAGVVRAAASFALERYVSPRRGN